ncbi:MAG: glycosyltransferase family 2 protein, partial [Myxococcaceae bacterium]
VMEIPIQLHEKRQPSIHLFKRVPNVLKNVGKLFYVIRVRGT